MKREPKTITNRLRGPVWGHGAGWKSRRRAQLPQGERSEAAFEAFKGPGRNCGLMIGVDPDECKEMKEKPLMQTELFGLSVSTRGLGRTPQFCHLRVLGRHGRRLGKRERSRALPFPDCGREIRLAVPQGYHDGQCPCREIGGQSAGVCWGRPAEWGVRWVSALPCRTSPGCFLQATRCCYGCWGKFDSWTCRSFVLLDGG